MIPDSLRRVLDKKNATPKGDVVTIWRDGTVLKERANGKIEQMESHDPIPEQPDDNPFPHD